MVPKIRKKVRGKRRKVRKVLRLSNESGLLSHYKATGTWRSNAEIWFEERFRAIDSKWCLDLGELIKIEGQKLIIPDFKFTKNGRVAYMEILGFWRSTHLKDLIEKSPGNVLFAVSKRLSGQKEQLSADLQDRIVLFSEIIPPKKVLEAIEIYAK